MPSPWMHNEMQMHTDFLQMNYQSPLRLPLLTPLSEQYQAA